MRCLAAAFLLLALGTSALAEPVHFKDCGESRASLRFRALRGASAGTSRRDPELGWAGPGRRPGSALDPSWSGSGWVGPGRVGEKMPASRTLAPSQLCLRPWNARAGSLGVPGEGRTFC